MDRIADLTNCVQTTTSDQPCNHAGFLDKYEWGYNCGNCGAAWVFKDRAEGKEAPDAKD